MICPNPLSLCSYILCPVGEVAVRLLWFSYLYKILTLTDTQCWHLTTYLVPTINVVLYFGNMVENKDTQVIKWLFNCPFSDFTL